MKFGGIATAAVTNSIMDDLVMLLLKVGATILVVVRAMKVTGLGCDWFRLVLVSIDIVDVWGYWGFNDLCLETVVIEVLVVRF